MNKNNDDSKVLYHILGLKASHITGIIISSYITIIFLNLGIKEQTISLLVASIGVTYPIISMICGISSDRIGRFKVYLIGKIVSIVFIFLAFFFVKEKILALCLYVVEAVENGIEPLIYAVATDNSNEKTRMKIFTWLSLGGSIGMMLISLITAYLMDFNMQVYIVILLLLELISLYFMYKSERNVRVVAKNKEGSLHVEHNKMRISNFIRENIYIIVFATISITFSILYSQLNYSLVLTMKRTYGNKVEGLFGILLFIYYFVTILFTIYYNKKKKKRKCIDNLICAGTIYTICMILIVLSCNIVMLAISLVIWAIAQMLVGINNNVFVSENCDKNNVGILTVIFSIISCSGVVIGPIISGLIIHIFGIITNWIFMIFLGALGTIGMVALKKKMEE